MFVKTLLVNFNLVAVNKEIATFNCNDTIHGVIHCTESGPVTVILDGGYILEEYHCPHCAIEDISKLYADIARAESVHGTYQAHKKNTSASLH